MKNKQYTDLLLNQTNDLIWMVDQELQLVYANKAYLNLMKEVTGVEKELNSPILAEGFGEGYIEKWKTFYQKALLGESFTIEEHFFHPGDKKIHYGHISFSPIKDEEGTVQSVACRNTDVTSIVQEKYKASSLMDASLDVFCTIDEAGNLVYVSEAAKAHWGYSPDEIINTPYIDLVLKEDIINTNNIAAAIVAGEEVKSFVNRYKRKDGSIAFNLWSARWDDEAKLMYCVARDAKERIQEEHRLKLLSSVITNTNDAVLITEAVPFDEPGPRIIYVNEAFTKMTGYTADEVIGKTPRILQGPKSDKEELAKLGKALRNWRPYEITTINYKKNGEEFWINFTVTPVADETGWYTHWIAIERDVTAQKNAELEKALLAQISTCFLEEELNQAGKALCKVIQDYANFDLVELWCPNLELTNLSRISVRTRIKDFEGTNNSIFQFLKGEGLPGKVWEQEKQLLWNKEKIAKHFLRIKEAINAGLTHLLGIPLTHHNQITGVLVIGSTSGDASLQKFSGLLKNLESFIGSEINRKKLETDLSHLYQAIPDILCIADLKGRFLKMNPASLTLLGYTEEEILFHSFDAFAHPEDKGKFQQKLKGLPKESTVFNFENRFLSKDGLVIWLSWNCNTALEDGLIYASAKNITAEVQLRELNAQAGSLAKIGSWEVNLEKNTVFWSKMLHQLHETDADSFMPDLETAINFYREDFRSLVSSSIENSIATGVEFDFEAVIITKKLKEKWIRAIGNVEIVNGTAKRIFGSFQDISDRKEIEIRLQSFANNLPGVVFQYIVYPDGTDALKYVTKGAEEIWEHSPEEVMENINLVWNQTKAGGDYDVVQKNIKESIKSKTKWISRYRSVSPSGKLRMLLGTGTPSYLADGTVAYNSVVLDITNEAKNEALLDKVSKIAKIGSWETDLLHGKHYKSKTVDEILGLELNQEIPSMESAIQFCREDFRDLLQLNFINCIKKGQSFDCEVVIFTANKSEKWVRIIASPEMFNGNCVKIYGSLQDIHKLKIVEHQKNILLKTIENSLNEIYVFDAQTLKFISVNKGARSNIGYSENEILELTPLNIEPEFNATTFNELITPLVTKEKEKIIFFTNHKRKNGSLYPVEVHLQFIVEGNNKRFLAIILDITERKKAEEKLLHAYQEKENILESIGDAFFAVDNEWIVTYWNKQAETVLGKLKEDILDKNLWEEFPDAIDTDFYRQYYRAKETGETVNFEEYYPTLEMWIEVTVYPSENGLSIYFKDITLRKEADTRLLQANERFEKVTQATNDAIWDWDIKNDTFYRSQNILKFFGEGTSTALESKDFWTDSFYPDDLNVLKESISKALNDEQSNRWEMEYRILNDHENTLYVIDRGLIIRDKTGKAIRMIGAMTDITERKQSEQQLVSINQKLETQAKELRRSNEELEQFAFITSHDLQEPLRMISSFMDQLERKYADKLDDKAKQYIHFAKDGAKRMKQIILDLLLYSRINRPTEQEELVNLNEIVSEFLLLRRKLVAEKKAIVHCAQLPIIVSYKAPVIQIFHCLLDNALKYSRDHVPPAISIQVVDKEAYWEFAIKDNGIGIDDQFYEKVFIIFQRLHNRREYDGTGIGLSIAKRAVEFLGGKIWIDSIVGNGSTFYFTISKTKNYTS